MTVTSLRRQPAMQAVDSPVWLERKGRGVVSVEREEGTGNTLSVSASQNRIQCLLPCAAAAFE